MASTHPKNGIPERALKLSSKFHGEDPCGLVKKELAAILDYSSSEKNDLDKLNSKLSSYVTRVRNLEEENKEIIKEIDDIKSNWGHETQEIKEEYEIIMTDIRNSIDTVAHLKTIADVSQKRADYEDAENRRKAEENYLITDYHTNRIKTLERELLQLKESHSCLLQATQAELQLYERYKRNRNDAVTTLTDLLDKLDDELFRRIGTEYNNQTLREQLEFMWQINQRELCEMKQLSQTLPFNEQIEFFKDQLKRVISLIRKDYEIMYAEQTKKMEEWMQAKKEELERTYAEKDPIHDLEISLNVENSALLKENLEANEKEIKSLKADNEEKAKKLEQLEVLVNSERDTVSDQLDRQQKEVGGLNEELNALTNDYSHINIHKQKLEYEITVYKRLLDSQLNNDASPPSVVTIREDAPKPEVQHKVNDEVTQD